MQRWIGWIIFALIVAATAAPFIYFATGVVALVAAL